MQFITSNLPLLIQAHQEVQTLISKMLQIQGIDDSDKDVIELKSILTDLTDIKETASKWDKTLLGKNSNKEKVAELNLKLIELVKTFLNEPQSQKGISSIRSFISLCHISRDIQNPVKVKEICNNEMEYQRKVIETLKKFNKR
ncbi:hypothetical protein [Vibrio jasicida]|uniref:hypothetical protein n=1 Tax=Vibrio jasicida TaxID=766224 RepID=UPI0005EE4AF0|nr:hypothetical protein [Vibrio jasicida]